MILPAIGKLGVCKNPVCSKYGKLFGLIEYHTGTFPRVPCVRCGRVVNV
jgi:hypothetical protein